MSPFFSLLSFPFLLHPSSGIKSFSTNVKNNTSQDRKDFLEWFRGFVDAEGFFLIRPNRGNYTFVFGIGLHIDDLKVLEFIQKTLQMGKIYTKSDDASIIIQRLDEIKIILDIFSTSPLNSNKQLNFLAFKKAFEIHSQSTNSRDPLFTEQIEAIRASMNNNRTDFV